jgi:hypothetical protein
MKRLRALEPKHTAAVRLGLVRQFEEALAMLAQFDALPGPAGISLIVARISSRWLIAPLQSLYEACGSAEADDAYEYLTRRQKAQAPPAVKQGWGARLRSFITTEGAAAVRGITETTRKVVRDVLNQAAADGLGIAEAARNLRAKVVQLVPTRARRIVRTELITAANYGSQLGAAATGLNLDKFWIATPGSRTRPTHRTADRQTVPMNGVFTVGGLAARYPGDPLLSAAERCNCRCSIGYKVRE